MAERRAKATLIAAVLFSSLTIWAVHFQQQQEREVSQLQTNAPFSTYPANHSDHVQGRSERRRTSARENETTKGRTKRLS